MNERKKLPTLSIITISWNQMDDIVEYLEAMEVARKECRYPIEMILVDNGSVDGTPEMVEEKWPWVKLVRNEKNEGFARGCNIGLHAATGEFLMLLNPDAQAVGISLEGMVSFLKKNPQVGMVGCQLVHDDGLPQFSAYGELSPFSYIRNHSLIYPLTEKLRKQFYRWGIRRKTRPYTCAWIQGSCIVTPRHVYEEIGDMEESFFIYCEDTDWCHRARKAGYKVVHIPNLKLPHGQMGSVSRKPEYFFRRVYRSIVHYTNRQFHEPKKSWIFRTMWIDMKLRVGIYGLFALLIPSKKDRYNARIDSVRRMIAIISARDPELFDDPPPR